MTLKELVESSTQRVQEGNYKFYWQADGYKFDNKHLASWYEKEHNCWAQFVSTQLPAIKQVLQDKTIDMHADYNAQFLQNLRSKYDYVQLFFSGGYDSVTILQTAINNDIKINETLSCVVGNLDDECNREIRHLAIPYLEKSADSVDKISFLENTYKLLTEHFSNPYRFFIEPGDSYFPYSFGSLSLCTNQRTHASNSVYIKGSDKPQLAFYNNHWYVCCLDTVINDAIDIPGIVWFWYDADNIKSLVRDARLFREYLLKKTQPNSYLEFYKPDQGAEVNQILKRFPVYDETKLLRKNIKGSPVNAKHRQRFHDAINNNQYQLLTNYFTCAKKYQDILGYESLNKAVNNLAKFAWFIDIDTLQVYSQNELIPNGFQPG